MLYNQHRLLDAALDAIEPNRPDAIDLYLLAIAGDGSQEVFRREVEFVEDLFARNFDTAGRSLSLINSRTTWDRACLFPGRPAAGTGFLSRFRTRRRHGSRELEQEEGYSQHSNPAIYAPAPILEKLERWQTERAQSMTF
ncbi:MAG: hypothetical protein U5K56_07315 [Halioglobus sp.]|nr:hypothetical protein [Halioglobus sp.]